MGKITATDGTNIREFTCEQYALSGYALDAAWTITENTCGQYLAKLHSPFASFGIEFGGTAIPGGWYVYKAVIASNRVIIPTADLTLPSNEANVIAIIRRQQYNATVPGEVRDFTVNNADNSVDFEAGLNLNGQIAFIRVFK